MGDIAPISGVLVPEDNYRQMTVDSEMLPFCESLVKDCTFIEPSWFQLWGVPILAALAGAYVGIAIAK